MNSNQDISAHVAHSKQTKLTIKNDISSLHVTFLGTHACIIVVLVLHLLVVVALRGRNLGVGLVVLHHLAVVLGNLVVVLG
jgi:hypothetical protein